jgi:hypothetical protein
MLQSSHVYIKWLRDSFFIIPRLVSSGLRLCVGICLGLGVATCLALCECSLKRWHYAEMLASPQWDGVVQQSRIVVYPAPSVRSTTIVWLTHTIIEVLIATFVFGAYVTKCHTSRHWWVYCIWIVLVVAINGVIAGLWKYLDHCYSLTVIPDILLAPSGSVDRYLTITSDAHYIYASSTPCYAGLLKQFGLAQPGPSWLYTVGVPLFVAPLFCRSLETRDQGSERKREQEEKEKVSGINVG